MHLRFNSYLVRGDQFVGEGWRPFVQLQRAASKVLPSRVPGPALRGGGPTRWQDDLAYQMAAPFYSGSMRPFYETLFLDRAEFAIILGEQIAHGASRAGIFGAPLGLIASRD
jgi:hypothetical protein